MMREIAIGTLAWLVIWWCIGCKSNQGVGEALKRCANHQGVDTIKFESRSLLVTCQDGHMMRVDYLP